MPTTHDIYEASYNANLAKLRQLSKDAKQKHEESHEVVGRSYWEGFHKGIERAISVLEGRG